MPSLARICSPTTIMRFPLACLLAIGFTDLVIADEPEKLVNAQSAKYAEYPFAASIRVNTRHRCGGTIITRQHIMTAAHCIDIVQGLPLYLITVVTGTNSGISGGQTHRILQSFRHEHYRPSALNHWDIAIIKLMVPMTYNLFQRNINLPMSKPFVGLRGTVIGWGSMIYEGSGPADWLQKLEANIITEESCRVHYKTLLTPYTFCALSTKQNSGICDGDSGSPLIYNGQAIGIVNSGILCAQGYPDIYINVHAFTDFIIRTVRL